MKVTLKFYQKDMNVDYISEKKGITELFASRDNHHDTREKQLNCVEHLGTGNE